MKNLLVTIALLCGIGMYAQDYTFKNYDWDEKATTVIVPEKYKNENEVILDRNTKIELAVAGNVVKQYYLLHEKILINSDEAIERNNKMYIPFNINESVLTNKVRVILKNGKVIKLDKKDIKEETDEEKGVKYNYFAVNGLEKGAIIERLFVLEEDPELKGKTFLMQASYPIANLDFSLIYPNHLNFKTKSYNGLQEQAIDTASFPGKLLIKVAEKDIPALHDDEQYSNWIKNLKRFRYKLDANNVSGARNLSNYKEFATNLFERLHPVLEKKELKTIDDLVKQIPKSDDLQEQIWNIENKMKQTLTYSPYFESKETITDIIKSKQANQTDMLKVYLALFKHFNIENNVVISSNRYTLPFDSEFESYENLNSLLFYFPTIKKFMTPTEVEYRIPLFPSELASNNGLFIKSKTFGGVAMGVGEINQITIPGADITHDVMEITVDFTKGLDNPKVRNKIAFGGYSAMNFQPLKDYVSAEQYQTILKSVAENFSVQAEYESLKSENDGTAFVGKKPFILDISFDGKDMVQKAGANYLFSVGQTIGKQTELYQETKRMLPVEIDYPHSYTRTIRILLPEGVTAKNLEKLAMDHKAQLAGNTEAAFNTNYKVSGNEITISNTEFYNVVNYPLTNFEDYRAVINAAADFNKVVIILTK
ncbi:MAG TPA: DUF3857 domain-containing protein [Flavobacterium sp.]|jgi:hypothetical protein